MSAIPEGFHTVTPTLTLKDAGKAIDLYKKAFGATELHRMNCPETNKVMHAAIKIGDSVVFLSDEMPEMGCTAVQGGSFYLYVPNADTSFKQARQAGLEEVGPLQDMFWGDRTGSVKDAFGVRWTVATHVRDVSPEEMKKGMQEMAAKGKKAA